MRPDFIFPYKVLPVLGMFCFLASSCSRNVVLEVMRPLPPQGWAYSNEIVVTYPNTDTAAAQDLLIQIRHRGDYPYRNLHVRCLVTGPEGDSLRCSRDVLLSDQQGYWLGQSALGDNYLVVDTLKAGALFQHRGNYTVRVIQNMRDNPLPAVVEVGLRIEKEPR